MSYSFRIRQATKAAAKAAVAFELGQVAGRQAAHVRDTQHVLTAANAFVDVLPDDESQDVDVSVSGSLSGVWGDGDYTRVTGVNVCITASLAPREG